MFDKLCSNYVFFILCSFARNKNISRGYAKKLEFLEEKGGISCGPIFENSLRERSLIENPFLGSLWIFSGTTHFESILLHFVLVLHFTSVLHFAPALHFAL